jgi:hypothetical protein
VNVAASSVTVSGAVPWAALAAGLFALAGLVFARLSERRDRRRTLYSEAYRAALAWVEMLYRVRRRDPARPYEIAAQFHKLQEDIDFHEGWIASESTHFARAYQHLVHEIKTLTLPEIQAAWAGDPADPADGFSLAGETHPDLREAKQRFLTDMRQHLSILPAERLRLRARYSEGAWELMNHGKSSTAAVANERHPLGGTSGPAAPNPAPTSAASSPEPVGAPEANALLPGDTPQPPPQP